MTTLGIKRTDSLGQYLGMSSQTSRNKRNVFNIIKEKVRKVLQGWKEKCFSQGGKKC